MEFIVKQNDGQDLKHLISTKGFVKFERGIIS